ncbi:hypothetical protein CROQUDRAFT_30871, partial [Cronartium quercuum f. sp. fusiforme G11]
PVLCIDNFDILQQVHHTHIESSNLLFHVTWGFLLFLPNYLLDKLNNKPASLNLESYL